MKFIKLLLIDKYILLKALYLKKNIFFFLLLNSKYFINLNSHFFSENRKFEKFHQFFFFGDFFNFFNKEWWVIEILQLEK